MLSSATGRLAVGVLVKSVGWACTTYTFMQIVGGRLSGTSLLGLAGGGLVYGLGLFAFGLLGRAQPPAALEATVPAATSGNLRNLAAASGSLECCFWPSPCVAPLATSLPGLLRCLPATSFLLP